MPIYGWVYLIPVTNVIFYFSNYIFQIENYEFQINYFGSTVICTGLDLTGFQNLSGLPFQQQSRINHSRTIILFDISNDIEMSVMKQLKIAIQIKIPIKKM